MTQFPDDDHSAAAFAALRAIQAGEWDRFLLRIRAAIRARLVTEQYQEYLRTRKIRLKPPQK